MAANKLLVVSNYEKIVPSRPEAEAMIRLHRQGLEVEIITLPNAAYTPIFRSEGIVVHERHPRSKRDLPAQKFIRETLIKGKHDVIHLFNSKASLNGMPAAKGLPVKVVLYRGFTGHIHWYDPTAYLKYLHPREDGLWCIAKGVEEMFHRQLFFRKSKTKVIHKGHHPSWYADVQALDLHEEGLPQGAMAAILVANARKMKGIPNLLKMTYHLPTDLPIHLFLVGRDMDTPALNAIRTKSPNKDKIHLLGYRKDALRLVKGADVFVLSSLYGEAITKAVIEAMSVGTVPLVTNIPGNRDLVIEGVSGKVVPVGEPKAMARALEHLYRNKAERLSLSEKAQAFIQDEFHIDKTVTALRAYYDELVR